MENKLENAMLTKRNVDLVFCIDGTGSMGPCIENVKGHAKKFFQDFMSEMSILNSEIDSARIKLIVFRDYKCDDQAMEISDFYELPEDQAGYEAALNAIVAKGGGDANENGLEALYYAMTSKFLNRTSKDRQVIVLFTDADALDLKQREGSTNYPAVMVDLSGLQTIWACADQNNSLSERCKRLVIFAPKDTKYEKLGLNPVFQNVQADKGMVDIDFKDIIKLIAATATKN